MLRPNPTTKFLEIIKYDILLKFLEEVSLISSLYTILNSFMTGVTCAQTAFYTPISKQKIF